ncbi:hypothetical protein NUW58_g9845 [Xylaria curta]|uniref:Uncharacterized protein n=1 Tax=Xylaria curta TaxID=42375 RepID=A0ACC1MTK6_9PEZI|nr:hypothetical protein NUW58_g9845 [Xylaria curta]
MLGSLLRRRLEFVGERAAANPPSVMALDLCTTHPAFQRRGIGAKLVQWGLDEAHRRGIPGADIEYELDDEFKGRDQPANVFMLYSRF